MRYTFAELKKLERPESTETLSGYVAISTAEWNLILSTVAYYENLAGEEFKAPMLSQATTGFLVDELGVIRKEIKARQTYEGVLKTALAMRRAQDPAKPNTMEGDDWGVMVEHKVRAGLDTPAIREEMGEEWCQTHTKRTEYDEWRTYKKG